MKYLRHSKIIELINKYDIETQKQLAELLEKSGFNVTQATVSRDIKELRLIKVLNSKGKYKYADSQEKGEMSYTNRFLKLFKDAVLSVDSSGNIIVVKTLVGSANAAAAAIDALNLEDIIGTIAGDDTIFLLLKNEEAVEKVTEKFLDMMEK